MKGLYFSSVRVMPSEVPEFSPPLPQIVGDKYPEDLIARPLGNSFLTAVVTIGYFVEENERYLLFASLVTTMVGLLFAGWVGSGLKRRGIPSDAFISRLGSKWFYLFLIICAFLATVIKSAQLARLLL